ncbi:MAG: hypothetical protein KGQ41_07370 [Alphaproteobacteria bacterium]|nr:hypothetical protein [Alphaproteobacteria bacterium]
MDKEIQTNHADPMLRELVEGRYDSEQMIDLFIGVDDRGRSFYMYLAIPPSNYLLYREKVALGEPIDIKDHGEMIAWGFGNIPPKELQAEMSMVYGFDHTLEGRLNAEIAKHLKDQER